MVAKSGEALMELIRDLEQARYQAMVEADGERLGTLLSERLTYVHTNGKCETKRQLIESITSGRRRYQQIEVQSQDISPFGAEACAVTGRLLIEMEVNHGSLLFPVAYTILQVKEAGHWRLAAWQATRYANE